MSPKRDSGLDSQQILLSLLPWSLLVSEFFRWVKLWGTWHRVLYSVVIWSLKELQKKKKEKQNKSSNAKPECVFFLLWKHHCLGEKANVLARSQNHTPSSLSQICLTVWPYPLYTLAHPFVKQGLAYLHTSWNCSEVHSFCFVKFLEIT